MYPLSMEVKVMIAADEAYHQYRTQKQKPRIMSQYILNKIHDLLESIEEIYGEGITHKQLCEAFVQGVDIDIKELELISFETLKRLVSYIHDSLFDKPLRNKILHAYFCELLVRHKADTLLVYNTRRRLVRGRLKDTYSQALYCMVGGESDDYSVEKYIELYESICGQLKGAMHMAFNKSA